MSSQFETLKLNDIIYTVYENKFTEKNADQYMLNWYSNIFKTVLNYTNEYYYSTKVIHIYLEH